MTDLLSLLLTDRDPRTSSMDQEVKLTVQKFSDRMSRFNRIPFLNTITYRLVDTMSGINEIQVAAIHRSYHIIYQVHYFYA